MDKPLQMPNTGGVCSQSTQSIAKPATSRRSTALRVIVPTTKLLNEDDNSGSSSSRYSTPLSPLEMPAEIVDFWPEVYDSDGIDSEDGLPSGTSILFITAVPNIQLTTWKI